MTAVTDQQRRLFLGAMDALLNELDTHCEEIAFQHGDLKDVLDAAQLANSSSITHDEYDSAVQQVMNLLTHIPSNPSHNTLSDIVLKSYQFTGNEAANHVNASPQSAAKFVAELAALAMQHQDSPKDAPQQLENKQPISILVGHRGAGKTFFMNYVSTRFNATLSRMRVILVRVAMTKDLGFDNNIEDWFMAQALKVMLRYYDPKSDRFNPDNFQLDVSGHLRNSINRDDVSSLQDLCECFMRQSEVDISPERARPFARSAFRFARNNGVHFIFMLDGFDRLGRDIEANARFDILEKSVGRFLVKQPPSGVALVVSTRHNTYSEFLRANQAFGGTAIPVTYNIGTPTAMSVLLLRTEVIQKLASAEEKGIGKSEEMRQRIRQLVSGFRDSIRSGDTEVDAYLTSPAPNLRAAMQAAACLFLSMAARSRQYGYRIIEQLLHARMRFPPIAYRIRRNELDRGFHVKLEERTLLFRYDGFFAPPLFIIDPVEGANGLRADRPRHLLKQFSLQYRILWELAHAGIAECSHFSSNFSSLHDEDVSYVEAAIDLLENYNCIESTDIFVTGQRVVSGSRCIEITMHGQNVLLSFSLDPAFLNACAFRLPVSQAARDLGVLRYAELVHDGTRQRSSLIPVGVSHWIEAKLFNTLLMYALLRKSIHVCNVESPAMQECRRRIEAQQDVIIEKCIRMAFQGESTDISYEYLFDTVRSVVIALRDLRPRHVQ